MKFNENVGWPGFSSFSILDGMDHGIETTMRGGVVVSAESQPC